MSKGFKAFLLTIAILLFGIPAVMMLIFAVSESLNRYSLKTVFGDRLDVNYDDFKDQSIVSIPDTREYFTLKGKITNDDLVLVSHTDTLTIYSVCGIVIFNDAGKLKKLNNENDVDDNPEVAKIVMHNIVSDPRLFEYNIRDLLKSRSYATEAEYVVKCINNNEYSSLDDYGIKKLKGTQSLERIKHEAWQIKRKQESEAELKTGLETRKKSSE